MKASDTFTQVISDHLQLVAAKDPLFAETLKKPDKNIEDCTKYILNEVKKSGRNGFADAEIFNMAIHYYDEDNIEKPKDIRAKVVVNHIIEKTSKAKAYTSEKKAPKPAKKAQPENQTSLF